MNIKRCKIFFRMENIFYRFHQCKWYFLGACGLKRNVLILFSIYIAVKLCPPDSNIMQSVVLLICNTSHGYGVSSMILWTRSYSGHRLYGYRPGLPIFAHHNSYCSVILLTLKQYSRDCGWPMRP